LTIEESVTEAVQVPVLRIHHCESGGVRVAELDWDGERVVVPFRPALGRFDLEDLRWYHENYRESWAAASEDGVNRIRRAQRKIGEALHAALFAGGAASLAAQVRSAGAGLRVEIRDDVYDAAIPWELLADPEVKEPMVVRAAGFVRTVGEVAEESAERATRRVLLLISRPGGVDDIGYWTVAYELWRTLGVMPRVKVDVLRPPTFEALGDRLRAAVAEGMPYAAVHFDGHGTILNPFGSARHTGYLVFETAGRPGPDFVDGATLGGLLAETAVLLLSMNACRSADSAGGDRHLRAEPAEAPGQPSIAEEVLAAGVPACVGMGREVYPGTPSRFFAVFYTAFFGGDSPGEAARVARARLYAEPLTVGIYREASPPIDDWCIPVVHERVAVRLASPSPGDLEVSADPLTAVFPEELLAPPVVGFDRAILTLETRLADAPVVLVYGGLLAGKSRLAAEYARWFSATSPEPRPVAYLRLDDGGDPVPDDLGGGLLVVDQADHAGPAAGELVRRLSGTGRVIVTARSPELPWLPAHQRIVPDNLPMARRAALGQVWARDAGVEYDAREFHPLVYFCGGHPGVLLLLLDAVYDRVNSAEDEAEAEYEADQVTLWLKEAQWDRIAELGTDAIERVIDQVAADVSDRLDGGELAVIPYIARFNSYCDAAAVARLMAAVTGAGESAGAAAEVMGKLVAAGLVEDAGTRRPGWWLHPLLKLVASRLPQDTGADLDGVLIDTVTEVCAGLITEFRAAPLEVSELLLAYKQNMADTLWMAMERRRIEPTATLTEAICLSCRYEGDVDLASRVLDKALLHFLERDTFAPQLKPDELAARIWYQAIWVSAYWPRQLQSSYQQRSPLMPPDDDYYADGLYLRATGDFETALRAFSAEMDEPGSARPAQRQRTAPGRRDRADPDPRYYPGDLEWHIAETILAAAADLSYPTALDYARRSYAARLSSDAVGRASSRVLEARIRLALLEPADPFEEGLPPDDLVVLEEIDGLLSEAMADGGGRSAENRAYGLMVWASVMLGRGDLTAAVAAFGESVSLLMALQEADLWRYNLRFAHNLIRQGWIARGYEVAQAAFHFAMQTGDLTLPTRIRTFCEYLEATHPELTT
jgi:CHAT domain